MERPGKIGIIIGLKDCRPTGGIFEHAVVARHGHDMLKETHHKSLLNFLGMTRKIATMETHDVKGIEKKIPFEHDGTAKKGDVRHDKNNTLLLSYPSSDEIIKKKLLKVLINVDENIVV